MTEALIEARRISVTYGATTALDGVDLDAQPGEVHAVVGENGAGKSTLLRVLAGVARPGAGAVQRRPRARLAWVPQETELPADRTAAEWIFLGCERRTGLGWLDQRAMHADAAAALRDVACAAAPGDRLGTLPAVQRKQVQLARALHARPDVLLLDEPTAVLGAAEGDALFAAIRRLRAGGAGILYVSHRLDEVLSIADRVTVLRDGRHVSTDPVGAVDSATLVHRMVGRDVDTGRRADRPLGSPALRLTNVTAPPVRNLSLTVRRSEIVGLAGLVGAGRSELLEAIAAIRSMRAGYIEAVAPPVLVPEDRARKGLVGTLSVRDNIFLPAVDWLMHPAQERAAAQRWVERLQIRTAGVDAPVGSLSGGNQQKLLLARALRHQPQVLLLDEPTAGVDVGAKAEIHDMIRRLAVDGTAILLASSDLPELLLLCDRIVALRQGRLAGELEADEATEPQLAALITGVGTTDEHR